MVVMPAAAALAPAKTSVLAGALAAEAAGELAAEVAEESAEEAEALVRAASLAECGVSKTQ
jgi:hypothetical protein